MGLATYVSTNYQVFKFCVSRNAHWHAIQATDWGVFLTQSTQFKVIYFCV
jgi:hypothetical protein